MTISGKLFTHPACSCGPTIDLVKAVAKEFPVLEIKEISLITPEGRKEAFAVGVKTIPSLLLGDDTLFVTSKEITKDAILAFVNSNSK